MSWREGMAAAYAAGKADGERAKAEGERCGRYLSPDRGAGFDACYYEGFGHGAEYCRCPNKLGGKRDGRRCVCCGNRREEICS